MPWACRTLFNYGHLGPHRREYSLPLSTCTVPSLNHYDYPVIDKCNMEDSVATIV